MAILHVRDVPDDIYRRLKEKAEAEGRSITAETIILLREALAPPYQSQRDVLEAISSRRRFSPKRAGAPLSEELIREDRGR